MTSIQWTAACIAALIIGVSKTGIPGIGILAVTVLAMAFPAKLSVGVMLPMLIVGDVFAAIYYRRKPQWRIIWRVTPPAVIGIVIGYFIMKAIGPPGPESDALLKRIIGGIALGLLTLQALSDFGVFTMERVPHHWAFAWSLALLAGVVTMLSNAAGPIILIFFLAMKLDKLRFIGSIAWYFLLLNLFKVPFFVALDMISVDSLTFDAMVAPIILIGAGLGLFAPRLIPERPFRWVIMVLASAAAVKLLASGW
ncbi:MAG TPA: sulfite exporter TauE/SafE family protein [Planctomycetota bacterium]|nr:sulfite exporter TauE/SafE family protein [Planctomycetota bacterium]